MQSLILVVHVVLAMTIIGLVLIQHGKGADAGAAFGSGASATVFGAKGSASFLTKMTTLAAVAFFVTSIVLFYLAAHRESSSGSVVDGFNAAPIDKVDQAPKAPAAVQSDLPAAPAKPNIDSDVPVAPAAGEKTE